MVTNMIERQLEANIREHIGSKKAIIIMGPRQVGKSTLLHQIFDSEKDAVWFDADNFETRGMFDDATSSQIQTVIGKRKYVIIDEAQSLLNAGLVLKRITDYIPNACSAARPQGSVRLDQGGNPSGNFLRLRCAGVHPRPQSREV